MGETITKAMTNKPIKGSALFMAILDWVEFTCLGLMKSPSERHAQPPPPAAVDDEATRPRVVGCSGSFGAAVDRGGLLADHLDFDDHICELVEGIAQHVVAVLPVDTFAPPLHAAGAGGDTDLHLLVELV